MSRFKNLKTNKFLIHAAVLNPIKGKYIGRCVNTRNPVTKKTMSVFTESLKYNLRLEYGRFTSKFVNESI